MSIKSLQDILPLVERPSRYLGTEINRIVKDRRQVKLHFALAFPDLYEIGTSHFGLQILYDILNQQDEIAAERVFAPGADMEAFLRSSKIPLMSLETHQALSQFDIIGFSLLYELNYTNILNMLELAGIPFMASERDQTHPLIIAGGPCACNPEPVADFFDAVVVGDGERVVLDLARGWLDWNDSGSGDKRILLKAWSEIEGVYIPSFFEPHYDSSGFQGVSPKFANYQKVSRTIVADLEKAPFPEVPILPFGKPVHDRLRLELSRGCTRGCRFCQAGVIYRPVRERSIPTLLDLSERCLAATGYEDISLLSLSTGDYGCIAALMGCMMERCAPRHIALSLPSIRAGTLTPELMDLIKKVRKTGFTIAPEAGSQRLRDVVNKNITRQEIIDTVSSAFELGWQLIKLYFMVGLPTETDADLQAIVDLVRQLRSIRGPKGRKGKINVSVTTFIPKPATPFQWAPQISLSESRAKIQWLQQKLKMPGIHFKWQNPEASMLEGLWARGDRRHAQLLIAAHQRGCKFDGWSDKFQYGSWQKALSDCDVDMDFYTTRRRNLGEPLPWDHIDTGVSKSYLQKEWALAAAGESTPDCRWGSCNDCGVCDFKAVAPKVFSACQLATAGSAGPDKGPETFYKQLEVSYSKQGQARFFGHLEMVSIFIRAIRRAAIPVKFSQGFHPMPKVSFDDPLPIGMQSLDESLYLTVPETVKPELVLTLLNTQLPEGLKVHACRLASEKVVRKAGGPVTYRIQLNDGIFDEKRVEDFINCDEFILTRSRSKGKESRIDLKKMIKTITLPSLQQLHMTMESTPGYTVRPSEVLRHIFDLSEPSIKRADVVKMPAGNAE